MTPTQEIEALLNNALRADPSPANHRATQAIWAALQTREGRKAAGLPPRTKRPTHDPNKAAIGTIPFEIALAHAMSSTTRAEAVDALIEYLGGDMDPRTAGRYLDAVLVRAKKLAETVKQNGLRAN